ncbi:MAG: hypothetical protein RL380_392 [Verrucomicrobiota bacterium]|jgi:hypothetical protein
METTDSKETKSACGCGPDCQCATTGCASCGLCKNSTLILTALLLMTLGLGLFFFRQAKGLNKQVQQGQLFIKEYNEKIAGPGTRFLNNLQAFAKSNPDFAPILSKYNLGGAPLADAPKK